MSTCGGDSFFFMSSGGIWGPFFMSSPPKYLLLGPVWRQMQDLSLARFVGPGLPQY